MKVLFYVNKGDLEDGKSTTKYIYDHLSEHSSYDLLSNDAFTLDGVHDADVIFHRKDSPLDLDFHWEMLCILIVLIQYLVYSLKNI